MHPPPPPSSSPLNGPAYDVSGVRVTHTPRVRIDTSMSTLSEYQLVLLLIPVPLLRVQSALDAQGRHLAHGQLFQSRPVLR